jgi:acyl-CoA thioesterase-2
LNFDQDALLRCLELTEVGLGVVEGENLDIGYYRVFGGQILAQMITAASDASPDKVVKSIQVLFPREGDATKPMRYSVRKLQDGRTFGATEIVATQGDDPKVIASAVLSMHAEEDGLHRSDGPPAGVAAPVEGRADLGGMVPWETSIVDGVDIADKAVGPPDLQWWMRAQPLGDARHLHQALLAHATDLTLIGTGLRPFEGISQADSTVTLHTAVTSHTLWFHQPFRADSWLLAVQHAPVTAGGRTFGRGDVFAGEELVASFAQEAMVRQLPATDGSG